MSKAGHFSRGKDIMEQWYYHERIGLLIPFDNRAAVTKLRSAGSIRPADQFDPARQIPCTFFKHHVSDCGQQCNSIGCCPSRYSALQRLANREFGSRVKIFGHLQYRGWVKVRHVRPAVQ